MIQIILDIKHLTLKNAIIYALSLICTFSGLAVTLIGLYMDPQGELHSSLLTFYEVSLIFCTVLLGISVHIPKAFRSIIRFGT